MTLLYFAPVLWDSYPQRPHFLIRHVLKRGGHVIWVDPYPTRLPALGDFRRLGSPAPVRLARPARLQVVHVKTLPIEPLTPGRWLNRSVAWRWLSESLDHAGWHGNVAIGIGRPSQLALCALERKAHTWSFYDAMDDVPEFYRGVSRTAVRAVENDIAGRAHAIFTSSSALFRKFEAFGDKRTMLRNGYDMSSLPPAAQVHAGHPVFGYVGCIGDWFDWSMVLQLAASRWDSTLHLVGPCVSRPPQKLPSNVRLYPECGHDVAVEYMRGFSVGLIPFRRSRLTEGVDPIKYYGYRGMGLPVLSTAFGDMATRTAADGVYFLDGPAGVDAAAEAALSAAPDSADVAAFRQRHDWQQRFEEARGFELMSS